jgi:hypothetical protein
MKTRYFYVHDITPGKNRKEPIGAWIHTENGSVDYVFSADYPDDEQIASDAVNRLIEKNVSPVPEDFLEYWRENVGYFRSASGIVIHNSDDYIKFIKKVTNQVK